MQQRHPKVHRANTQNESHLARTFSNLMFKGKTHAALDLVANSRKGGVLHLDQLANSHESDSKSVRKVLVSIQLVKLHQLTQPYKDYPLRFILLFLIAVMLALYDQLP